MSAINLLPQDLSPRRTIVKASDTLKRVSFLWFMVILVFSGVMVATFFVFAYQIRSTVTNQEGLKSSIKALQQTENQLILVKDRLQKIEKVAGLDTAYEEAEGLSVLRNILPEGAELTEAELTSGQSNLEIKTTSSVVFSQLMSKLVSSSIYKFINIESFEYTPTKGYLIAFSFRI